MIVFWTGEHERVKTGTDSVQFNKLTCVSPGSPPVPLPVANHDEPVAIGRFVDDVLPAGPAPMADDNFSGSTAATNVFYSMSVEMPQNLLNLLSRAGQIVINLVVRVENSSSSIPAAQALGKDPRPKFTFDFGSWLVGSQVASSGFSHGTRFWVYKTTLAAILSQVATAKIEVRWDFSSMAWPAGAFSMDVDVNFVYSSVFYDANWAIPAGITSAPAGSVGSDFDHLAELDQ